MRAGSNALRAIFPALAVVIVIPVPASSQTAQGPSFQAASIKVDRSRENSALTMTPGRITFRSVTLKECVMAAFDVREYQVAGADALTSDRYDILANAEGSASNSELRAMLKTLLADRFKLKIHTEIRELSAYRLISVKKLRLTPAATDQSAGYGLEGGSVAFHNTSMSAFADYLSGRGPIDRPVVDGTGIDGLFDFRLKLFDVPPDMPLDALKRAYHEWDQGSSIFTDLQEQLGLRLQAVKAPIEVLVVDFAAKPTED